MSDDADLTLREVLDVIETLYPPQTAQSWDRVGLVTGDPRQPVRRIHLAVDPTLDVIAEARELGADLLLTHHPLLLRGVHSLATTSAKGASVTGLIVGDVALYVAHTNADVAAPGVSDALARVLGLTDLVPLSPDPTEPLDRIVAFARSEIVGNVVDAVVTAGATTAGPFRGGADGDGGAGRERQHRSSMTDAPRAVATRAGRLQSPHVESRSDARRRRGDCRRPADGGHQLARDGHPFIARSADLRAPA